MKKNKEEIIEYINSLEDYRGYIQFSHRPINKDEQGKYIDRDIFIDKDPKVENENGFIYEAHFCNGQKSIMIRQINNSWIVSETVISQVSKDDIQSYISDIQDFDYKIKMAQIWAEEEDEFCNRMKVKKLKKVVFVGFNNG